VVSAALTVMVAEPPTRMGPLLVTLRMLGGTSTTVRPKLTLLERALPSRDAGRSWCAIPLRAKQVAAFDPESWEPRRRPI
jgi:hypothetical protein